MQIFNKEQVKNLFFLSIVIVGTILFGQTLYRVSQTHFNYSFLIFAVATLFLVSGTILAIPGIKGQVSPSDSLIILSFLLFGTDLSIILAGTDALFSSIKVCRKYKFLILFNFGVYTISAYFMGRCLSLLGEPATELIHQGFTGRFIAALFLMAGVQFICTTGLVAIAVAMRANEPIFKIWRDHFVWTALTHFASASAAGFTSQLINAFGIYAFLATVPLAAIAYFSYSTYLKNVAAAAAQTEVAQKHVAELSHHIAEQERISRALTESEEYFRNAFDNAAGMALVHPSGQWLKVNNSLSSMLGYENDEMIGRDFQSLTYSEDLGSDLANLYKMIEGGLQSYQLEKRYLHSEGHLVWVLQNVSLIRRENGKPRHLIFQIQDVTDRKRAEEQIHHAAFHDALTGLPNRTLLSDRLSMAMERAKRNVFYHFAILFVDLDRFKVVNDSLGHTMGDKLLIELSRRLETCVRGVDTVARVGGDEFAILLDDISDSQSASETAERLQELMQEPFDLDGHQFFTTASIGIAFSGTGYVKSEDILRDADTAMYKAKTNGKGRHEIFNLSMQTHAAETLKLENDLRRAVENGDIVPYYQPIVTLATGKISGFEALARWNNPQRGVVSPANFIPLAEETGLILPLGLSMLNQACRQVKIWQEMFAGDEPLTVSVNLSGKQFRQSNLVEEITNILRETKFDPNHLRLEITESVVMDNAASAAEMLKQLKTIGVQLSIDDFGTGYSSLSYLHRFPFDILKIDRSFVANMGVDKESRGIVKTIVTLASELNKAVVAEGVELEEHRVLLTELACQYGQGFLFSKPLDAAAAENLLHSKVKVKPPAEELKLSDLAKIEELHDSYTM